MDGPLSRWKYDIRNGIAYHEDFSSRWRLTNDFGLRVIRLGSVPSAGMTSYKPTSHY